MLSVANLTHAFAEAAPLLRGVSFTLNRGERAALIGANGSGKTTLLRLIAGQLTPDEGQVSLDPRVYVGLLAQDSDFRQTLTLREAVSLVHEELREVATALAKLEACDEEPHKAAYAAALGRYEALGGYDYERRAGEVLLRLGFQPVDLGKPVRTLSGGQKTRAALARLLLAEPDLLLLDEPTNHLDLEACEWLAEFLKGYRGTALIISHDRFFLDQVATSVLAIEHGEVSMFPGNYTQTAAKRAALREAQARAVELQQREIERMEEMVTRLRRWAGKGGSLWGQVFSKEKVLERLKAQQQEAPKAPPRTMKPAVAEATRSGTEVLVVRDWRKEFPTSAFTLTLPDLLIRRGDRIGLVGPNGAGKTTFLRTLIGDEPLTGGSVTYGTKVRVAYFAQQFDHLRPELAVLEELLVDSTLSAKEARHLLGRYQFRGDAVFKPVAVLSGGERCRLALAKLLLAEPNLLLLDEPTNHLDLPSREVLENALRDFTGTMLIASHDRYLLEALVTSILEIRDGHGRLIPTSYREYRMRALIHAGVPPPSGRRSNSEIPSRREQRAASRTEQAQRRQRLSALERELGRLGGKLSGLTVALADPQTYRGENGRTATQEYRALQQQIAALEREWESLVEAGS